jgi:hypothetical protein
MNWKLIGKLSLFGLAMGLGTVFLISSTVEPLFWIIIFLISAYLIARQAGRRYFLHGVLTGLANSVWVTASHILLFDRYIARHPHEAAMMATMPRPDSPRLMMALVGPLIGLISGVIIGLFAVIAAQALLRRASPPPSP